jgi:putative transcriptional regulator
MKKKLKEVPFDAEKLLQRVTAYADGTAKVTRRMVKVPEPVKPIAASEIRAIRINLGFTQPQFATFLNVPKITAKSWESGKRKPSGAALRLLAVARHNPEAFQEAV